MADATSVGWAPDAAIVSLVSRIIGQHGDALAKRVKDDQGRIVNDAAARGVLRSGGTVKAVREARVNAVRRYANDVAREVVRVFQAADGTLDVDAGRWIRKQLEPNFEAIAKGIADAMENESSLRGLPMHHGDAITSLVAELNRDLGILVDKVLTKLRLKPTSKNVVLTCCAVASEEHRFEAQLR